MISIVLLMVLCHGLLSTLEAANEEEVGDGDTACVKGAQLLELWV